MHTLALTAPMEAKLVEALPDTPGWQFEPKWDGFRAIASRRGNAVEIMSKSGKPLGRYFPEIVALLAATTADESVIDGELILPLGNVLSFGYSRRACIPPRTALPDYRSKRLRS